MLSSEYKSVSLLIRADQIDSSLCGYISFYGRKQRRYSGYRKILHSIGGQIVGACVYCMVCEGEHGDEDGFGVEPDIYAIAFEDAAGQRVCPYFELYSEAYQTFAAAWKAEHSVVEDLRSV